MLDVFFKQSNLDFDKSSFVRCKDYIFVKAYFICNDELCPNCGSRNLIKNGHVNKKVKYCVYNTSLIIVNCNFQSFKCKNCNHIFTEKNLFSPSNISFSYESIILILEALKYPNSSFESVARTVHISIQNAIHIFNKIVNYTPSPILPIVLSSDKKYT